MDNEKEQMDSNNQIDWDDDSGVIHTHKENYHLTKEDGWQENRALRGMNKVGHKTRNIKGTQVGYSYVTDDYRAVIPAYIIGTIIVIIFCVVATMVFLPLGIMIDIMGVAWVVGMWKNAPYKKWKNQAQKRKEQSQDWR